MLEQYNFKATFYPTISSPSLTDDAEKWKALAAAGHELGNHTIYHPCQKSKWGMDWVQDEYDLDQYSLEKIYNEIKLANDQLEALDGKTSRTFAYPCAHFYAGGENYKKSLNQYVTAARGSSGRQESLDLPYDIDLFNVTSWAPNNDDADALIDYIDKVIENETLSTFTFHGVGAEHMMVTTEAHEAMLKYLDEHRGEIWVTTFMEATDYIRSQRR